MKTEEIIKKDLEISTFNAGNPLVTTKIEDVYSLWIYGVKLNSKPNTIVKYEGIFRNHISDIKNIPIAEINRATVNVFTKKLQSKGLSNKTINDILIVLNMLLNYAAEEYEINIPKIKYLREPRNKTRYLTVAEEKRLIDYLMTNTDVHKFGTLLALFTGIRIGELCALKWEDITENTIVINKTMTRVKLSEKSEVIVQPPKSECSVRIIPYPKQLLKLYNKFKQSGYVMSTKRIEYTEPRYMQMKFEKYVHDCELKGVTFHTLRHTFATRCIEAGVDAKTVSELLGHYDTNITLNRYIHSSFELKQNSIEKMENLLK